MKDPAALLLRQFRPRRAPATARIALGLGLSLLAVPAALFGALVLWLPHGITYRTSSDSLVILLDRGLASREKRFPRDRIKGVEPVELSGGRRRVGTSMPGYCVGTFAYPRFGTVWQATDCSGAAVLVVVDGPPGQVVVTPADRDGFRAALEAGEAAEFRPAPVRAETWWLAVKLLVLLPIPLVLVLPALFFVAPGRLTYAVGSGFLEVRTLFVRRRFALVGVSARSCRPHSVFKLAGSAFPGYYTGSFMLDKARAKVFATSLKEGVLVEGEKRVFVTPEDSEQFLATIAEHGARIDVASPGA